MKTILLLLTLFSLAQSGRQCTCGRENHKSRIVGGVPSKPNRYPWLSFIKIIDGDETFGCGGALINKRFILTAAHCFKDRENAKVSVYLKGHRTRDFFNGHLPSHQIEQIIVHEEYEHGAIFTNDIALVKLKRDILLSEEISPICLPFESTTNYKNFLIAGWGLLESDGDDPKNLMQVEVPYVQMSTCNIYWYDMLNEDSHLCAGERGRDSCQGDSGGPLMMRSNGKMFAAGIVSFGRGCGAFTPGVYAKVENYIPWILEHTRGYNYCRV